MKQKWKELAEDAANQIHGFIVNDSVDEISRYINDFYIKCPQEFLRATTMELICKIHSLPLTNTDACIEQIFHGFETYLAVKDNELGKKVFNQAVSNKFWKKCFKVALSQNAKKCEYAFSVLFHLCEPSKALTPLIYSRIKRLPQGIKEEWIQTFKLNRDILLGNRNENENITPTQDHQLWSKVVGDTVTQIQKAVLNRSFDEKCIAEFFQKCSKDSLRLATMELIVKIHSSFSTINSSFIIQTILQQFQAFFKQKDGNFAREVCDGMVLVKIWNDCFKIVVDCDLITVCSSAIDMLFHIRKAETEKRSSLIYNNVRKLLLNENQFNEGIEWIQIFKLNLEKLKFKKTVITEHPSIAAEEEVYLAAPINEDKNKNTVEPDNIKSVKWSPKLYSIFPKELRAGTMKQILSVCEVASSSSESCNLLNDVCNIIKKFELYLKENNENYIKEVIIGKVADNLWITAWEKCFEAVLDRKISKCSLALEQLFSIQNPENCKRKAIIMADVRILLNGSETFLNGIKWINSFNLKELKEKEFEKILYNSFIFGKEFTLNEFLSSPEDKVQCIRILEDFLNRAENNQIQSEMETNFITIVTLEKIAEKICKFAKIFQIDVEKLSSSSHRISSIQKIKHYYNFIDRRYFELYALEALKDKDENYKLDFLGAISDDQKYAYCWAKFLQIQTEKMPEYLQNCENFDTEAKEFIKKISQKFNCVVEKDEIETCHFWKKPYQVITVISAKAFLDFIDEYLIQSNGTIIGIDVEGQRDGQKAVLLQLATDKWACLIDIQELIKKLSPKQWKRFFTTLFGSDHICVGFAFINDFEFLCNTFSFLPTLLKECQAKVLCLQKLTNELIKDSKYDSVFLKKPNHGCGLARLAKAVLDYDVDKSEQQSDWTKRPLTQSQKIYAVTDAVIVVLIKKEIEKRLKKEYGDTVAEELMENSYISYSERIKNNEKKKKK